MPGVAWKLLLAIMDSGSPVLWITTFVCNRDYQENITDKGIHDGKKESSEDEVAQFTVNLGACFRMGQQYVDNHFDLVQVAPPKTRNGGPVPES